MKNRASVLVALVLGLAACLPVRVGDPEKARVDPRFNSGWLTREQDTVWSFRPWDERTWLVVIGQVVEKEPEADAAASKPAEPAVSSSAESNWAYDTEHFEIGTALVHKAWLTTLGGKQFLVLEPAAIAAPPDPKDESYAFSDFVWYVHRVDWLDADTLQLRMVDEDFGGLEDVQTSAEAERIIAENAGNPALYGDDPAKPEDDDRTILHRASGETGANLQRLLWKEMGYGK